MLFTQIAEPDPRLAHEAAAREMDPRARHPTSSRSEPSSTSTDAEEYRKRARQHIAQIRSKVSGTGRRARPRVYPVAIKIGVRHRRGIE
jgi:hypothetical protein